MSRRTKRKQPAPRSPRIAQKTVAPPAVVESSSEQSRTQWVIALIVVLTVLAYLPAMRGGLLWDDDGHVTKPELRSLAGLYRIWFELGATQQYYPLLHSAFWLEHKLWSDNTLGYHLVNVLQHAAATCLVYLILLRLKIPGALLAAAIFAVHPIEVESVAWITEQKNTFSALFYLSALVSYLRFDEGGRAEGGGGRADATKWYALALILFTLGLLAKTVTATLPAALLVIFWWQRGKLSWRRDVRPLMPFFLLGAAAGLFTAWVERRLIGAEGAAFELTFLQRGLLAGRAIWFYLAKLLWPSNLIFIYPRWNPDLAVWWQWLFPIAAIAMMGLLWAIRRRWRAPLAAWLFFVGTLFPVLGFLNVFPFIYSFVADHFQYLAGLGVIVLAAAGLTLAVDRLPTGARRAGELACAALVVALAVLTMRQSAMYGNVVALYRTTIEHNPACWMAYNNLGAQLADNARDDKEAMPLFRHALELKPDYAESHYNLANSLVRVGQPQEARAQFEQALRSRPNYPEVENNLGKLLGIMGQPQQAIMHFERAAALDPDSAERQSNLATALLASGDAEQSIDHFKRAVRMQPDDASFHCSLANALLNSNLPVQEAIDECRIAIRLDPILAEAHHNLGVALARSGQVSAAVSEFQETLRLKPDHLDAYANLSKAYASMQKPDDAMATAQQALDLARSTGQADLARQIEAWLASYRAQQAPK